MIRYLVQRPVAVCIIFLALLMTGLLLVGKVPVSLLPDVDVPRIVIRINYPNTSAQVIEQNIIQPVRENLATLPHLERIESSTANHTGFIYLSFNYNTRMDLAYIEVNEKIDRLMNVFPAGMERPQVIRVNTTDIPVVRIQVIPKKGNDYLAVSSLADKVLKKRLEQIEGVSLVDLNGKRQQGIMIIPKEESLRALDLDKSTITQSIRNAIYEAGGLTVKDGQYRYFVKLVSPLQTADDIAQLPVKINNTSMVPLGRLATIQTEEERPGGYHIYNGREGIVITVQKQPASRMNDLVPRIEQAVEQFKNDYSGIELALTQDQTFLLDAGISNLYQDLILGAILTVSLLFLFLGNMALPALMSISIPVSLIITVVFFYLFNISFNIISLSGLALGIGMLIDNSIVVLDRIAGLHCTGMNTINSCVQGVNEVTAPVISQVLTTVAVYAPLIILSGIASALIYEQSIALTISLAVSLGVAFILSPLLYKLFSGKRVAANTDTVFFKRIGKGYHRMISHILKHRKPYFIVTLMIMPIGCIIAFNMPVRSLPVIEKNESLVLIDWNDPVDAQENLRRTNALVAAIQFHCEVTEAEVGIKQFLLQQDNSTMQKADLYFKCAYETVKLKTDQQIREWITHHYPNSHLTIIDAPNAFTQLFNSTLPYFEARFKPVDQMESGTFLTKLNNLLNRLPDNRFQKGAGMIREPNVSITLHFDKMVIYGVDRNAIETTLQQLFGTYSVADIKRFGDVKNIRLRIDKKTLEEKMYTTVAGANGTRYPLNQFLSVGQDDNQKFIMADKAGEYLSVIFDHAANRNYTSLQQDIHKLARSNGLQVTFEGQFFEDRKQLDRLWIIFLVVLLLLYFILALQYENLFLPLIVMLTIPLGITGGMLLLWASGGSLNVMSAIGFIVILGLIVDDPILKLDTLMRLEKKYRQQGYVKDEHLLQKMIHEAGDICLKPLLMVSLTTSMAMVPVLFVDGLGNDLQRPLALVIIGGLTIGTFFTTWFIPLGYWYYSKWRSK